MRYPLPDSFDWGIHGYLCLPLPDDKQQRANILGALSQLLNWYTYERDNQQSGAKTAQAMRDLWLPNAFEILETCGGTERTVIERVPYTEIVYTESEDEVAQFPYYQKVNGIWYLGMPCEPCGGVEWVALGSGGKLGTGGGAQGRNPAIPYLPDGATVSGSGGASCYASKAVPYFADQVGEFWEWMIDASITAINYADLFTPVTEGFDAAAAVADAISGSGTTRELITLGIDVLKAVISAPGNITALQSGWSFTTIPSYDEIKSWIDSTTFPNEPAIAKKAWQTWALRLIVARHYAALNTMLVECGTGKELGSIAQSSVVFENAQYLIYEISGYPKTITAVPDIWVSQGLNTPVAGHALVFDVGTISDADVDVRWLTSAGSQFRLLATNGGDKIYTYRFNSTNYESVLTLAQNEMGLGSKPRVFGEVSDNPLGELPAGSDISHRSFYFSSPEIEILRLWLIAER